MERLPVMKGLCSLVSLMIFNGLSKELRVSARSPGGEDNLYLGRRSGWLFCALYLKQHHL